MLGGKSQMLSMRSAMAFKQDLPLGLKLEKKPAAPEDSAEVAENRSKKREDAKPAAKPMR